MNRHIRSIAINNVAETKCGLGRKCQPWGDGTTKPRAVVVTDTVAVPLPDANEPGLIEQCVAVAFDGIPQVSATAAEKPFCGVTEIAFVKVPVVPAATVALVTPVDVMEKSGGPVTVKLKAVDVPPGA